MLKKMSVAVLAAGFVVAAFADIIEFVGGTAYDQWGGSFTVLDGVRYDGIDYYIEDGMLIDFVGGSGIIGDYYGSYVGKPGSQSNVIHAHPFENIDIVFSREDGSAFDLNYVDMTSNTVVGGGASSGAELSYITSSEGYSMLLPSSDWGIDWLSNGTTPGDGIARLWLDDNFNNITSFTLSSENAYCFGMDNFYIDEPPPPPVPEPSTLILLCLGLAGLAAVNRKKKV